MARIMDLSVMLAIVLFVYIISELYALSGAEIPEWVQRQQSCDFYNFFNSSESYLTCGIDRSTYLVDENQCVKDQELFDGVTSHAGWISYIIYATTRRM